MITLAGNRKIKLGAKVLNFLSRMKGLYRRDETPIITILLSNFNLLMQKRTEVFSQNSIEENKRTACISTLISKIIYMNPIAYEELNIELMQILDPTESEDER